MGQISAAQLYRIHNEEKMDNLIKSMLYMPSIIFTNDMSVYQAYEQSRHFKGASIPVLDGRTQQFVGVVYVGELVEACMQALERYRIDER